MISIGIVAHQLRHEMADKLANFVGAEVVSVDDGTMGCKKNHIFTLDYLYHYPAPFHVPTSKSWAVILEDDAIPIREFKTEVIEALKNSPAPIVSLYLGRGRPEHWQEPIAKVLADPTVSWLTAPDLLHAVGYAIRWPLIPSLVQEVPPMRGSFRLKNQKKWRTVDLPIDQSISVWASTHGHQVAYTKPSLVNHADGISLIKDTDDERLATTEYLDTSPGLPSGTQRVAWAFGNRRAIYGRGWDSSSREIPLPVILYGGSSAQKR